jgi:hypothetical protein
MDTCSIANSEAQQWVLPSSPSQIHLKVTYFEGLCMDGGEGTAKTPVKLQECAPEGSKGALAQQFKQVPQGGSSSLIHLVHTASNLCVNLNRYGVIDLWTCQDPGAGDGVEQWSVNSIGEVVAKSDCLSACCGTGPAPSPAPDPPSDEPVILNSSNVGLAFGGVWAMSANGAARLLLEYPEPTRTHILDMLFSPGMCRHPPFAAICPAIYPGVRTVQSVSWLCACVCSLPEGMGTRWQGLKTEIGGDVESSYGSMSSYAHAANQVHAD